MSTVISTNASPGGLYYNHSRKIDVCQNGVLWVGYHDGTVNTTDSIKFAYSTDNGTTWNLATTSYFGFSGTSASGIAPDLSMFIDLDDYAHVVYLDPNNASTYYRRGTPNAGRTAWTWSSATLITSARKETSALVAHREGTGWVAHCFLGQHSGVNSTTHGTYYRVTITSGGTITVGSSFPYASDAWSNTQQPFTVADFNHTGDGKTVAGGTPHLYLAWYSQGGVYFLKGTYSSGNWSWGSYSTLTTNANTATYQTGGFDGTRFCVVTYNSTTGNAEFIERDTADTTTTVRAAPLTGFSTTNMSLSFHTNGDAYLVYDDSTYVVWKAFTRSAGTWGSVNTLYGPGSNIRSATLASMHTIATGRIGVMFEDGGSAPYDIVYDYIGVNQAPNAPTLTSPSNSSTIDRTATNRFQWTFSDPDTGDSQSAYDLRYATTPGGTWTTVSGASSNYRDIAGGTFAAGDYEWQVRTYDSSGVVGPYSASSFFTAADPPSGPTITDPVNGSTVPATYTATWTVANQDSYQVRTVADNAGSPDTGTIYSDTGEVANSGTRNRALTFPVNGRYEHVQVRVKYNLLWSTWASNRVLVSYTPPPTPTITLTADDATASITVDITNPAPGGGEPAVTGNDVYVDDGDGEERRVANVAPNGSWVYKTPNGGRDYTTTSIRVVALGDNGSSTSS